MERGVLPADYPHLGSVIQDICYDNAARYFRRPRGQPHPRARRQWGVSTARDDDEGA